MAVPGPTSARYTFDSALFVPGGSVSSRERDPSYHPWHRCLSGSPSSRPHYFRSCPTEGKSIWARKTYADEGHLLSDLIPSKGFVYPRISQPKFMNANVVLIGGLPCFAGIWGYVSASFDPTDAEDRTLLLYIGPCWAEMMMESFSSGWFDKVKASFLVSVPGVNLILSLQTQVCVDLSQVHEHRRVTRRDPSQLGTTKYNST